MREGYQNKFLIINVMQNSKNLIVFSDYACLFLSAFVRRPTINPATKRRG